MVADCIACSKDLNSCSDEDLVRLVLAGRDDAFRHLFDRHAEVFFRVAMSIVKNENDAQDAVQTAFLKMVDKLDTFHFDGAFAGWGYRIVRNAALMQLRRRKRRREVALDVPALQHVPSTRTPLDDLNDRQIREVVAHLLQRLEPKYRRAIELREIEGKSMAEIGEALSLSVGGAKTRLHRARHDMRTWLEHEYGLTPT